MGSLPDLERPHAVCIPFPAQGHINPMMKLAKLLHSRGFHVTFVLTHYNHARLLRSCGPHALDGLPSFRFVSTLNLINEFSSLVTPEQRGDFSVRTYSRRRSSLSFSTEWVPPVLLHASPPQLPTRRLPPPDW